MTKDDDNLIFVLVDFGIEQKLLINNGKIEYSIDFDRIAYTISWYQLQMKLRMVHVADANDVLV